MKLNNLIIKQFLSYTLILYLFLVYSNAKAESYGAGTGTELDPYLIFTHEQMNTIGANPSDWDKHFMLTADIDLSSYTGTQFNIIGNGSKKFTGVFNGNGYTITEFTYSSTGTDYVGLFGYVWGPGAVIKNLGLVNTNVHGEGNYFGSLVGYFLGETISYCFVLNCNVKGGSGQGYEGFGGMVGSNAGNMGTITNCYSKGNVEGDAGTGGLVGINAGTITDSYSTASVYGHFQSGGLTANNSGTVTRCYSTGSVSGGYGGDYVGGLVYANYGTCIDCFWDKQTSGVATSAGGTGKTTAEMKQEGTFTNWDFVDTWDIIENITYPFLRPYIMVTSPNGGESWERGTSHSITWNSSGSVGSHVKIELYKGESLNRTITSSTSNDGSYSWIISSSQTTGSDYKVKVTSTSDSSVYDHSDSYFSILMGIIGDFCGEGSVEPDGYVDYWDLLYFAQRWHTRLGDPDWDPRCDLAEEDDYVDYWDLLVFAQQWHKGQKP